MRQISGQSCSLRAKEAFGSWSFARKKFFFSRRAAYLSDVDLTRNVFEEVRGNKAFNGIRQASRFTGSETGVDYLQSGVADTGIRVIFLAPSVLTDTSVQRLKSKSIIFTMLSHVHPMKIFTTVPSNLRFFYRVERGIYRFDKKNHHWGTLGYEKLCLLCNNVMNPFFVFCSNVRSCLPMTVSAGC